MRLGRRAIWGGIYPLRRGLQPRAAAVRELHIVLGILALALNAAAGLWGGWCWWRPRVSRWFWPLLRIAQVVVIVEIAQGGLLVALGHKVTSLHLIYGLLPVLVALIAEQLRVASAEMVLGARGYDSAAAVAKLPQEEQRSIVVAIVQREMGVMALAALVNVVLLARAAGT